MHNVAIFDEPVKPDFEHVSTILKRLLEPQPGAVFDPVRSLALDRVIQQEELEREEGASC